MHLARARRAAGSRPPPPPRPAPPPLPPPAAPPRDSKSAKLHALGACPPGRRITPGPTAARILAPFARRGQLGVKRMSLAWRLPMRGAPEAPPQQLQPSVD